MQRLGGKTRDCDVLVLGAGASGLMSAWRAASRGHSVLVFDHGTKAARKVRISGGGSCNITNVHVTAQDYVSDNPHFTKSALARFTPWDMLALLEKHGIGCNEREQGRLFCDCGAGRVAGVLLELARDAGAEVRLGCVLEGLPEQRGGLFHVRTTPGEAAARTLVVATGGPAWPQAGATTIGYDIARAFGLRVVGPRPGLVPFVMAKEWSLAGLEGIALPVRIEVGGHVVDDQLLFTHRGISGPAALQASLYWRLGMELTTDFLPAQNVGVLLAMADPKAKARNVLARHMPRRLAAALTGVLGDKRAGQFSKADADALSAVVHHHPLVPTGTEGWTKAEATLGGVDTSEISSKTMQAHLVPGLCFIGEVLDVTGRLGGYNLHWAWASGHAAGEVV